MANGKVKLGGVDGLSVQKLIYEAVYISWALWENIVSFDWDRLPPPSSESDIASYLVSDSFSSSAFIFSPNLVLSFLVFSYLFFSFHPFDFISSSLCSQAAF